MVEFSLFDTKIGVCGIAWRDEMVVATCLADRTPGATERTLARRSGGKIGDPPEAIRNAITLINDLLTHGTADLSPIRCDFARLEPFTASVLMTARKVQPGETSTYGKIAEGLGDISLARRVGQVLGHNPFPIIVPCHRIIGAGDRMVGFSAHGGIELKLRMLEIEGAKIGATGGLFDELPYSVKPAR